MFDYEAEGNSIWILDSTGRRILGPFHSVSDIEQAIHELSSESKDFESDDGMSPGTRNMLLGFLANLLYLAGAFGWYYLFKQ